VPAPNSFARQVVVTYHAKSRLHEKHIRTSLCIYTHAHTHTHLHSQKAASTQELGAGDGFDSGAALAVQCHCRTATGTPLSRVTLYTLTQHDSEPSNTTASRAGCFLPSQPTPTLHWTPPSAATTRTRRSWCRCDAQHTHGTRLWLAGVEASWRDRVGFRVAVWGVAVHTSGHA
jgi:hypothetical protein